MPLLHEDITHEIIGTFYEVYRTIGHGFLESVYAAAMATELELRRIPFEQEWPYPVVYKGIRIATARADLVVCNRVIVELKTAERIAGTHEAQLFNYLRASGLQVGLILNFGPKAQKRRLIWTGREGTLDDALPGASMLIQHQAKSTHD